MASLFCHCEDIAIANYIVIDHVVVVVVFAAQEFDLFCVSNVNTTFLSSFHRECTTNIRQ